jgi:hypothetical protein
VDAHIKTIYGLYVTLCNQLMGSMPARVMSYDYSAADAGPRFNGIVRALRREYRATPD